MASDDLSRMEITSIKVEIPDIDAEPPQPIRQPRQQRPLQPKLQPLQQQQQQAPSPRLSQLLGNVDMRERDLLQAWSSLTEALKDYKAELKQISTSTQYCQKCSSAPLPSPSSSGPVNDHYYMKYRDLEARNENLNKQLKDCRGELKVKELDLVSKVCQLGLLEARLEEAQNRCNMMSNHLRSGHVKIRKIDQSSDRSTSSPATVLDGASSTCTETDKMETFCAIRPKPSASTNLDNSDAFPALSVEQLNSSVVEAFQPLQRDALMDPGTSRLMGTSSAEMGRMPRRRGRPPGPGRGRAGITVSMMMQGLSRRKGRRGRVGGRVMRYNKPRLISEMIALNQGSNDPPQIAPKRGSTANIPIRTLLHMNALGLDISDSANLLHSEQSYDYGTADYQPSANGYGPDGLQQQQPTDDAMDDDEKEDRSDPFSMLYVDPSKIKLEPVDPSESVELENELNRNQNLETVHNDNTTAELEPQEESAVPVIEQSTEEEVSHDSAATADNSGSKNEDAQLSENTDTEQSKPTDSDCRDTPAVSNRKSPSGLKPRDKSPRRGMSRGGHVTDHVTDHVGKDDSTSSDSVQTGVRRSSRASKRKHDPNDVYLD